MKTVSRIIKTTDQGARNLDFGLQNISNRSNVKATQYAQCPADGGSQLVLVRVTIVLLPLARIDLHEWFSEMTDRWVHGWEDQWSVGDDVTVSDA